VTRPFPGISASFRTMLILLIAVDLLLIGLNLGAAVLKSLDIISSIPEYLKVTQDHALPEDFNYLKWAVIVVALVWVALRDRWFPAFLWALIFGLILTDDAFQLHESLGNLLSLHLNLQDALFLFGSDLGEILVFLTMGLVVAVLILVFWRQMDDRATRLSARYLAVIAGLAFFGVGIDALHQVLSHAFAVEDSGFFLAKVFGLVEDGGEMLVASLAAALTLAPPERSRVDWIAAFIPGRRSG
jgi:hypothetical protein